MLFTETWLKISEACVYIRTHYGMYMDPQRMGKLRRFEWRSFPGHPLRVSKKSIDAAYEGPYEAEPEAAEAEAEPIQAA